MFDERSEEFAGLGLQSVLPERERKLKFYPSSKRKYF